MKSHRLTADNITSLVPKGAKGTYHLGEMLGNEFCVLYVGRSGKSLRKRLLRHAKSGTYGFFNFRSCSGNRTPIIRECVDFHSFANLNNKIHPTTKDSVARCPVCTILIDFESCIPTDENRLERNDYDTEK